jgi:formylglycine-generating enzyme required for sulfatase activity
MKCYVAACRLLALLLQPQFAFAEEVTIKLPGDVPMVLVKVPAGEFLMGSPEGERGNIFDNETQHQVTLTQDYYLVKTEVTKAQWEAVMGARRFRRNPDQEDRGGLCALVSNSGQSMSSSRFRRAPSEDHEGIAERL